MLRYAARESSVAAVRQSQSCRALIARKQGFSSRAPLRVRRPNPPKKHTESDTDVAKPLTSLELAFQKRFEQAKVQSRQQGGVLQRNHKNTPAADKKPWLSSILQNTQQQKLNRNNYNGQRIGNGQQGNNTNGKRMNLTQQPSGFLRNSANGAGTAQKQSTAATIRQSLAQKTSLSSSKPVPGIGSITKMLNASANSSQRPSRNKKSPGPSIREMLAQTASTTSSTSERARDIDMADISNLRDVFFKTVEKQNERKLQQEQEKNNSIRQTPPPAWKREGAKGFRKRLQEQQREQKEALEQEQKHRAAVNRTSGAFFMIQEDYIQDQQEAKAKRAAQQQQEVDKTVMLPPREATITELSALFRVKIDQLTKMLKSLGERPTGEDYLVDLDVMELLAMELGLEPIRSSRRRTKPDDDHNLLLQRRAGAEATSVDESDEQAVAQANAYDSLPPRPPVVCIMGHVDHGKTTLMDALRRKSKGLSSKTTPKKKKKSKKGKKAQDDTENDAVAGTEAGGITQVISAFQVPLENQENAVTFLDTPGHAAFTKMRESGSNAADVIVLVVAADDGVSPQTIEIINFYKSIVKGSGGGGISMVVAMTKVDKHGIDVDESRMRIENQLLEHGIMSESFGSSVESEYGPPVQVIPVSGLTGEGLDDLIEGLVLQSEVMDLRADEKAQGEGIVMDARMEKGVGVVADCIVRWGSLERGSVIVSGVHSGKIKALKDMNGNTIKTGVPSQPVRILGFKSLPKAGDPIICVHSEEVADQITERREALQHAEQSSRATSTEAAEMQVMGTAAKRAASLEATLVKYGQDGDADSSQIRIPVIVRADGEGSLAALTEALVGVGDESTFDLVIDPINSGIGPISATDVRMAAESGAYIFSFGVKDDKTALAMAEAEGVGVRSHDVIYSLLDEAKEVFAEHLPPTPVEVIHGKAKVQAIFDVNNKKDAERIAGLAVLEGTLYKGKAKALNGDRVRCHYRVLRKGEPVVSEGEVSSLRKVKEDVDDVRRGEECGLGLLDYTDYEKGDIIECYSVEMKREFV